MTENPENPNPFTDLDLVELAAALRRNLRDGHRFDTVNVGRYGVVSRQMALEQPSALDVMANRLHVALDTMIATECGPHHTAEVTWTTRTRPWWLPRWLWRRVPTMQGKATLVVDGERWFPDLGVDVGRVLRHDHVTGVLVDPEEDPEYEATWHD